MAQGQRSIEAMVEKSPTETIPAGLTLLLSLRFMAVAFEEVRNLAMGVAARGVQWPSLGPAGGLRVRSSGFSLL